MAFSFLFKIFFFFFIVIILPLAGTGSCEACGTFTAPPLLMTCQTGDQSHPKGSQSSPQPFSQTGKVLFLIGLFKGSIEHIKLTDFFLLAMS